MLMLEHRFLEFLSKLPGAESLDTLLAGTQFDGERRADYLLFGRRLIVEVKALQVDVAEKAEAELDKHREREDFPLFYGEVELHKVLRHLPDGDQISDRIYQRITRSAEDGVRSAEKQIHNTARLLQLDDSAGIVVLLNEKLGILSPDVLVPRVSSLLTRTGPDGRLRSPIASAWLIFESHSVPGGPSRKNLPMICLDGPRADDMPWLAAFMDHLQVAWARFSGHTLIRTTLSDINKLPTEPVKAPAPPPEPPRRYEVWQARYKQRPHLRGLSDRDVIAFGRRAFTHLMPYFLKDGPRLLPKDLEPLAVSWSEFL